MKSNVTVVIPALNEEQAIGHVLRGLLAWVSPEKIFVADNGSIDRTAEIAAGLGVHVLRESRRGYGAACLAALTAIMTWPHSWTDEIVLFIDADGSDCPDELERLIAPIEDESADLVIGSRAIGHAERGSLSLPQRFGNALASRLIHWRWGMPCTDLGPFRAIRLHALMRLGMSDLDYGWTVQMQARAARFGLRVVEAPVTYRQRIGKSKISGTIRGVLGAGWKILSTIACEAMRPAMQRTRLIIFSRVPKPGITKTRLIPALGEAGAAQLHIEMTRHTLDMATEWSRRFACNGDIEIRFTGGTVEEMMSHFDWMSRDAVVAGADSGASMPSQPFRFVAQAQGDLGDRLAAAFDDAFNDGDRDGGAGEGRAAVDGRGGVGGERRMGGAGRVWTMRSRSAATALI